MSVLNKKQVKLIKKQIKTAKKNLPNKKQIVALSNKALHKKQPTNNVLPVIISIGIGAVILAGSLVALIKGSQEDI